LPSPFLLSLNDDKLSGSPVGRFSESANTANSPASDSYRLPEPSQSFAFRIE